VFGRPAILYGHCPSEPKKASQPCPMEKLKSSFASGQGSPQPRISPRVPAAGPETHRGQQPGPHFPPPLKLRYSRPAPPPYFPMASCSTWLATISTHASSLPFLSTTPPRRPWPPLWEENAEAGRCRTLPPLREDAPCCSPRRRPPPRWLPPPLPFLSVLFP
jgi:hypothetical protein